MLDFSVGFFNSTSLALADFCSDERTDAFLPDLLSARADAFCSSSSAACLAACLASSSAARRSLSAMSAASLSRLAWYSR